MRRASHARSTWMRGLQSRNGGFAAFDADCDRMY
ncbi:hypothetical protein, partial [Burkholderia sp. E168m30]